MNRGGPFFWEAYMIYTITISLLLEKEQENLFCLFKSANRR